jgi:uncharacterized YigZ family protein
MDDTYLTVERESKKEMKVKGSRFIGEVFKAGDVEEALMKLDEVRRREHAATHHCYAYIVGRGREETFKYSDDGEPSGTAGRPIYDVIAGTGITDVLCVVTRYFGGTKLGTGGLARAYGEAAREAVKAAGVKTNYLEARYRFVVDFSHFDRWQNELRKLGAEVISSDFSDTVLMDIDIRLSRAKRLLDLFTELTSGKGQVEELSSDQPD